MKDLDFIKNKFDESEVNAPENLNKETIFEKLNNTERKKPKKAKILLSSAACIAVLLITAISVKMVTGGLFDASAPVLKTNKGNITFFKSREEVIKKLKSIKNPYSYDDMAAGAAISKKTENDIGFNYTPDKSSSSSADSYSETYKQVEGVDEADIVKTDGKYIYAVIGEWDKNPAIAIYNTRPDTKPNESKSHPEPELETKITIKNENKKYRADFIHDIFVCGNKLIANVSFYTKYYDSYTASYIYDVSDKKNIKQVGRFIQSGYYVSSRIVEDSLYLVTNFSSKSSLPKAGSESTLDEIPAKNICCPEKTSERSFLVVSSVEIGTKTKETVTKAILGAADTVYCNGENLYAVAEEFESLDRYYGVITDSTMPWRFATNSQIIKFDLKNGIKPSGSVKVKGSVNDNYSLDEKDGYLRVAANYEDNNTSKNRVYVFDSNLTLVGKTEPFGKGEHIKAVKYVGDTAYAITYRETDPLFVIDLSNVTAPKILGSVKIDGFSSMLVPINDSRLLGVGFGAHDYVKLVIFDVSDPGSPKVLDSHTVKYAYSDVQYEPKAFVYNPERDWYTIPVNDMAYAGAYTFSVKGDKINELDYYTPQNMENCDRCVYIGDSIYLVDTQTPRVVAREYKN